ncbi:MAG: hypothetical protein HYX34_02215 [Actinobacteria bacterium]|nr:hypothetical protein [Actinomycetota bacterium]
MNSAPFAPWSQQGESLLALCRARPAPGLAPELSDAPGPTLLAAIRYTDSPVGPYLALAVMVPARLRARFGWSVVLMVVDHPGALTGACLNWGFPAMRGTLRWLADGPERRLVWEEGEVDVRGRGRGVALPVVLPHSELQVRGDGPVIVPDRLWGLARPGAVRVSAPADGGPLAALAGRHLGAHITSVHRIVREARTPVGLRAPLRAPTGVEPVMAAPVSVRRQRDPALSSAAPGAYSSVG